jgi:hypothetical protein
MALEQCQCWRRLETREMERTNQADETLDGVCVMLTVVMLASAHPRMWGSWQLMHALISV